MPVNYNEPGSDNKNKEAGSTPERPKYLVKDEAYIRASTLPKDKQKSATKILPRELTTKTLSIEENQY